MTQTTSIKFSDKDGNVEKVIISMGKFGFTNVKYEGAGKGSVSVFHAVAAKFALSKTIPAIARPAVLAVIEDMAKGTMPEVIEELHDVIRPADQPWGFRPVPKDAAQ